MTGMDHLELFCVLLMGHSLSMHPGESCAQMDGLRLQQAHLHVHMNSACARHTIAA